MTKTGKIPDNSQKNTGIFQALSSSNASGTVTDTQEYWRLLECYNGFTVVVLVAFTSSQVYAKCVLRNEIQLPIHCNEMHML